MTPRRANEIKTAIDNEINYSRNPLSKEPATEQAFSGARRALSKKVDEGMSSLGGDDLLNQLKSANKEYGNTKQIQRIAEDRVSREQANRMFGLTDTIASAGGGVAAATVGGGPLGLVGAVAAGAANKLGRSYGNSTMAVGADKVSQFLLRSKPMQEIASKNPAAFKAIVADMTKRIEQRGSAPKAAQAPGELDRDSSTPAQERVSEEDAKKQFLDGN
jgi:hypothetical protein